MASALIAFVMTDVVGSSATWDRDPNAMNLSIALHDALVDSAARANHGERIKERGEGDSCFLTFSSPSNALRFCVDLLARLQAADWPGPSLRVRIAGHVGESFERARDHYGPTINRCARIRALAGPSQILLSDLFVRSIPDHDRAQFDLADLGVHRLKDLLVPERIWSIRGDGDEPLGQLKSLSSSPNNLPVQLTDFVGRRADIEALSELIRKSRIVTILGAGGLGKTRLAMQVGAELADDFVDGVWWIDLLGASEGAEKLDGLVAQAIGLKAPSDEEASATVSAWLSGRQCLLVLDNCEHVVAAASELVERLASISSAVRILTTSRHTLHAQGEATYSPPPMTFPPAGAIEPSALMEFESARLLVERTRLRNQSFQPTEENAAQLAEICRKLEGLPLAIELAAPKLALLGPKVLLERLDNLSRALSGGPARSSERHRTIEATITWSYRLLSDEEQALLRRLSIFAGTFARADACEIFGCGAFSVESVEDLTVSLQDKSFVNAAHREGEDRIYLLEPIRQYAAAQLSERSEYETAMDRLCAWIERRSAEVEARPEADSLREWQGLVASNVETFRKALRYSIEHRRVEQAFQLCIGIHRYWIHRSAFHEASTTIARALELGEGSNPALYARVANIAGAFSWFRGAYDEAETSIRRAIEAWDALGSKDQATGAIINLGLIAYRRGDFDAAAAEFQRGIDLAEATHNIGSAYMGAQNLATILRDRGDFAGAAELYERCLDRYRTKVDDHWLAVLSGNLAACYVKLGRVGDGIPLMLVAFEAFRNLENRERLEPLLVLTGHLALSAGNSELAERCLAKAVEIRANLEVQVEEGFESDLFHHLLERVGAPSKAKFNLEGLISESERWLRETPVTSLRLV